MRRSTIREVALRDGVSYQTVSRVINNSPDVAEATREHVLRVIAELDYTPMRRQSASPATAPTLSVLLSIQ